MCAIYSPYLRQNCGRKMKVMADPPKPADQTPNNEPPIAVAVPRWAGTGLCCEAQGDGVPCKGTDGECEACGRALPIPEGDAHK